MTQYSAIRYGKKERIENVAYYHIPTSKIDEILYGFPLQIVVEAGTGFLDGVEDDDWKYLHASSGNIGEAGRECYIEIDQWDPDSGTAVIYVKVWEVTKTKETVVKLFFSTRNDKKRVGITFDLTSDIGSRVWDENFVAVYHMSQDPTGGSGCIKDSTSNANHGTPDGTMLSGDLVDGDLSKALDFDGIDDVVDIPAVGSLSAWTITSIVTTNTLSSEKVLFTNDLSGWNDDVLLGIDPESGLDNGYIGVIHQDSTDSVRTQINSTIALAVDGTEYAVSAKANGSSLYLKVNNETTVSLAKQGTALDFGNNALQIGFSANGTREWYGQIGELRLSNIARSEAWIKVEQHDLLGTLAEWSADGKSPFGEKLVESGIAFNVLPEYEITRSLITSWLPPDPLVSSIVTSNNALTATGTEEAYNMVYANYQPLSEKFYFEVLATETGSSNTFCVGVGTGDEQKMYVGDTVDGWGYMSNGRFYNSTLSYTPDAYTDGDIIGVAVDLVNGYIWWSKNNVWQASGDPENGTNPFFTNVPSEVYAALSIRNTDSIGTVAFYESQGTYTAPEGFAYYAESLYLKGEIDDPEIGFNEEIGANFSLANRGISDGVSFSEVVGGGIYELIESHYFGTNNEGADSPSGTAGSPTMDDEWVSFDGNDGYYYANVGVEDEIDVKVVFRIEEALDEIAGSRCIWKSGGSTNGIGFGISTDPDGVLSGYHIGAFACDGGTRTGIFVPIDENLFINTWYEAFITKEKITIRMEASPSVGFTQYGTLVPGDGGDPESVGYADSSSPLTAVASTGDYFIGSVASTEVFSEYTMDMPDDLSAPVYTSIELINFGSLYDGKAPSRFPTEIGTVTENTDNVEFDGTEGLRTSSHWGDETLLEFVVGFSCDSFASAATFYKAGGSGNGIAVGVDDSGNIGIFGANSSSYTSITVPSTTLSTGTEYILYATQTEVRIYDAALTEIFLSATGSITPGDGTGEESVGVSYNTSPITGSGDTYSAYLDGSIYFLELWLVGQLAFPVLNVSEGELDEDIGLADTINGELVTAIENFSAGIGFSDETGASQVSTQKESSSTIGFSDQAQADHIDESTGEVDSTIGFNEETGAYNATIRNGSEVELGLTGEADAHVSEMTVGLTSTIGLNDSNEGRNESTEVISGIGFSDETGGYNSIFHIGISEDIGLLGTAEVDITFFKEVLSGIGLADEVGGHRQTNIKGFSSSLGLNGLALGGNPLSPDNLSYLGLSDEIGATHYPVYGIEEEIGFTGEPFPVRQYVYGTTEEIGFNVDTAAENFGDLVPVIPESLTYKYFVTLTGANDSTTDLEIEKIKTIQLQLKETDASNVIISAVYSDDLKDAIALRTHGTLVVEMASIYHGEEIEREEIMEVDFSTVRYDLGGTSQSATINGYRVNTYDSPDTVYLIDLISMRTGQAGQSVYRFARPDIHIKPGYKVAYRDERFTADQVSFYIGDKEYYMDVRFDPNTLSGSNEFDLFSRSYVPYDRDRKFTAVLTGAADGEDDLDLLGLESLQVRLSPGAPSYVSVKVAYVSGLKDLIEDRPNGDIKINVEEAGSEAAEWLSFNFNEVSYSLTPKDRSCTLVGYRIFSFHPGDTVVLENISEKSIREGGTMVLRSLLPDISLQPMSTITFESYDYLAGEISFNFDRMTQHVDIQSYSNITVEKLAEGEIGMTGASISNAFYPSESTSELGMSDSPRVSINDEENAGTDSEIGLSIIAVAELDW